MRAEAPRPPAHVEPYVRVLGAEGAIDFFLVFGGCEIYLAERPTQRNRLSQAIGKEKAVALASALDVMTVRVPVAKPWIAGVWSTQGLKVAEIARRLHVTDVTVRNYLKRAKETGG